MQEIIGERKTFILRPYVSVTIIVIKWWYGMMSMKWYNNSYIFQYSYKFGVENIFCWRKGPVEWRRVWRYPKNLTVTKHMDLLFFAFGGVTCRVQRELVRRRLSIRRGALSREDSSIDSRRNFLRDNSEQKRKENKRQLGTEKTICIWDKGRDNLEWTNTV